MLINRRRAGGRVGGSALWNRRGSAVGRPQSAREARRTPRQSACDCRRPSQPPCSAPRLRCPNCAARSRPPLGAAALLEQRSRTAAGALHCQSDRRVSDASQPHRKVSRARNAIAHTHSHTHTSPAPPGMPRSMKRGEERSGGCARASSHPAAVRRECARTREQVHANSEKWELRLEPLNRHRRVVERRQLRRRRARRHCRHHTALANPSSCAVEAGVSRPSGSIVVNVTALSSPFPIEFTAHT